MATILTGRRVRASRARRRSSRGSPQGYVDIGPGLVPRAQQPGLDRRSWSRSILWILLDATELGRFMYAIGGNPEAARLVGHPDAPAARSLGFMIVALDGRDGRHPDQLGRRAATRPTPGSTYLLPAYAAAFLGAAVFRPGEFNIPGTVVGVLFLGVIRTGPDDAQPPDLPDQPRPGRDPDRRRAAQPARRSGRERTADATSRGAGAHAASAAAAGSPASRSSSSAAWSSATPACSRSTTPTALIRAGVVLGLLGKNGAGKSTLIKILAGVGQARRGRDLDRRRAGAPSTARSTRRGAGSPSSTRS